MLKKIIFWSGDPHMLLSVLPIYHKMKELNYDVDIYWSPHSEGLYRRYDGFPPAKLFPRRKPDENRVLHPITDFEEEYHSVVSTWCMEKEPYQLPIKLVNNKGIYYNHSLHGHELEEEGKSVSEHFNKIMFCGTWWRDEFFKRYGEREHAVVGWAKSDLLFDPNIDKIVAEAKKGLNLPYEKTIFYPMSICNYSDSQAWKNRISTLKFLLDFCKKEKINLIYNIHPSNYRKMQLLTKNIELRHNVTLLPWNTDTTELFPIIDVLINENSSLLWEFLPSGKPSIQLEEPSELKVHSDFGPEFGVIKIKHDYKQMAEVISECLKNPDINKEDREEALEKVHVADGHVVDRAIEFIVGYNK